MFGTDLNKEGFTHEENKVGASGSAVGWLNLRKRNKLLFSAALSPSLSRWPHGYDTRPGAAGNDNDANIWGSLGGSPAWVSPLLRSIHEEWNATLAVRVCLGDSLQVSHRLISGTRANGVDEWLEKGSWIEQVTERRQHQINLFNKLCVLNNKGWLKGSELWEYVLVVLHWFKAHGSSYVQLFLQHLECRLYKLHECDVSNPWTMSAIYIYI